MKKMLIFLFALFTLPCETKYIHFKSPLDALKIAAQYLPQNPVILEAGAYDGSDTLEMFNFFTSISRKNKPIIHCFEPIPYLKKKVDEKIRPHSNQIFSYAFALSDTTTKSIMHVSEEPNKPGVPSMSSSLLAPKEHLNYSGTLFKRTITVPTITIDEWARRNKIDHIDFMWLDMQGYELQALKAAPEILKTVKVILTEVEFVEAYKDQFMFQDIKDWLEEQGFTMVAENFGTYGNWFGDALFVRR